MKDPRAVELIPSAWSLGKPKSEWTYDVHGFWDGNKKHEDNTSFTLEGAVKFCKEKGFIICKRGGNS